MKKNILQHIIFWTVYILIWSAHDLAYYNNFFSNIRSNLFFFLPYSLLVYFNLYVLIPRFLLNRKPILYLFFIMCGILLVTYVSSWNVYFYFANIVNLQIKGLFFVSLQGRIVILTELLVLIGMTMTLYLLKEWYQKERYTKEIEKKRLETELQLLKSQINPHFLFNSLNSIYILLNKNQDKGKKMLLQFSDILSHQLYETNNEKVSFKKEIKNLTNYIDIEKIRHENLANITVELPEHVNNLQITPMLLLPIVENAFKHAKSNSDYWIKISADISLENELNFIVENSHIDKITNGHSGIGLTNVKRRLDLLYPDTHDILIENQKGIFKVNLKIQLQ